MSLDEVKTTLHKDHHQVVNIGSEGGGTCTVKMNFDMNQWKGENDAPWIVSSSSVDDLSEIEPWLYQTSRDTAYKHELLHAKGINVVVNVMNFDSCPSVRAHYLELGFQYHHIPMLDCKREDIEQPCQQVAAIFQDARQNNLKVVVHCALGVSRSSVVILAWLISERGYTPEVALKYLQEKRPVIKPNKGYREKLQALYLSKQLR